MKGYGSNHEVTTLTEIPVLNSTETPGNVLAYFSIAGAPRTKKTSQRVVRAGRFTKILPSKAHQDWFAEAMSQVPMILANRWAMELPIAGPVGVSALFFRERASGDLTGFMQALADFLQSPRTLPSGRPGRKGAGIIVDDSQIASWDGTRLRKDATFPRIEVTITRASA